MSFKTLVSLEIKQPYMVNCKIFCLKAWLVSKPNFNNTTKDMKFSITFCSHYSLAKEQMAKHTIFLINANDK